MIAGTVCLSHLESLSTMKSLEILDISQAELDDNLSLHPEILKKLQDQFPKLKTQLVDPDELESEYSMSESNEETGDEYNSSELEDSGNEENIGKYPSDILSKLEAIQVQFR